jgi:hypothetical protein
MLSLPSSVSPLCTPDIIPAQCPVTISSTARAASTQILHLHARTLLQCATVNIHIMHGCDSWPPDRTKGMLIYSCQLFNLNDST